MATVSVKGLMMQSFVCVCDWQVVLVNCLTWHRRTLQCVLSVSSAQNTRMTQSTGFYIQF